MYAGSAAEFTAEGTADILVNKYMPLWGCPASLLSNNGLQVGSKLSLAVYKLLGVQKITTSAGHLNGNGGVACVNHTIAQVLAMVVNERQDNWDVHLPHVEFAYNNSVSVATGLAPNQLRKNRLPPLPLTIFEHHYARVHQSFAGDHLAFYDLAADLTVRVERRNSALSDALKQLLIYTIGGWVWIYNTAATIRQCAKSDTDAKTLEEKLSPSWTGPFEV